MNKFGIAIIFVLGLAFLIGGSVFVGIFPGILKDKISEELPLVNGSDAWKRWQETKVPITMKFYFFEQKNSDYKSLDDIHLVEKGPYIYDEKRFKDEESIKKIGEDLMTYQEHKNFTLKPGQKLDENEEISFINFPVLGILQNRLKVIDKAMLKEFNNVYNGKEEEETNLFVKRKPVDILFEGVPYKIFKKLATSYSMIGIKDKYSIYNKKDFKENEWTINTGKKDIAQIGQIHSDLSNNPLLGWISKDLLQIWPNNNTAEHNCTQLKGTDGTFFAPAISKDDILFAYEPQLCRSVYFEFWKESVVRGINTYRFKIHKDFYKSPFVKEENICYCVEDDKSKCDKNGLLDVSHCVRRSFGAPIIMTAPYFINGDDIYRKQLNLKPKKTLNDENYSTYLDIEPMTGIVLKAERRLQMNVLVQKINTHSMPQIDKSNNSEYIVPVFWIEESGEADEDQADQFKSMVTNKKKLANGIGITVIVVGALLTIVSIYMFMRRK